MLKINLLVLFLKVTAYDESTLETFYNKLTHVSGFGGGINFYLSYVAIRYILNT